LSRQKNEVVQLADGGLLAVNIGKPKKTFSTKSERYPNNEYGLNAY
jgi:hypothetical protein